MRSEEDIRDRLVEAREMLEETTANLSRGRLAALDFTGIAGAVGIIQALEWVLEEEESLNLQVNPLRRPLDEI
jgi:hypothetical protein